MFGNYQKDIVKKLKEGTNAHVHQCEKISQYSEEKIYRWHKWHIPEVRKISEYFSGTLLTFIR